MQKEKVFLIHGLFMNGAIMRYLEKQLQQRGYEVIVFSYRTIKHPLHENAILLQDFVKHHHQSGDICHFVGHSLGGLLIRLAYELSPVYFTGRIVTIGTPHNGSHVAHRVAHDIYRDILGKAYEDALDGDLPTWQGTVDLGSIAGSKCVGIGMAMRDLEKPNDGTVAVAETQLKHQTDHIQIPLSHTALVFSQRVAKQVDNFLKHGQFSGQLSDPTLRDDKE